MTRIWTLSADRKFYLSAGVAPRPVPVIPADPESGTATRLRGRSVYGPPVEPPTWPPADAFYPTLPDQPTVDYRDFYVTGDDLRTALTRLNSQLVAAGSGASGYAQVYLPPGFDAEFSDFTMASATYGLFFPRILGFIGEGPDQAHIRIRSQSSTRGPYGTMLRLAGTIGTPLPGGLVPLNYGWWLQGTMQPAVQHSQGSFFGRQDYIGFMEYGGIGAINQRMKVSGVPGHWNSPPGETFQVSSYRSADCIWRACESDGRDVDGNRVGGSPFGGNQSDGDILEDFWMHHSFVSGCTWSFTGDDDVVGNISKNVTTRRLIIEHNANILENGSGGGKRFTGINHENVGGFVKHLYPKIQCDGTQWWDQSHMAINQKLADNPNFLITLENTSAWNSLYSRYMGCFVVIIPKMYGNPSALQKQTTWPTIKLGSTLDGVGGTTLTPYVYEGAGAPSSNLPVTPTTHYVILHS